MITRADRIDAVPWDALHLLDGSAAPLRALVRGLFDSDPPVALRAARELSGAICAEEYCVFDATTAALPFVIEGLTTTTSEVREVLARLISEITMVITPHADPWRDLRALPGAERILFRVATWRDDQAASPDLRRLLFLALPNLLASDTDGLAMGVATRLARAPEGFAEPIARLLSHALVGATGRERVHLVRTLIEIGAAGLVPEPAEGPERWLWLAADPQRAPLLADVVTKASLADVMSFEDATRGLGFFVELGAPLTLARPDLGPAIARALVAHAQRKAAGSDAVHGAAPGPADLLLVFPGATLPARLEGHQVDLLELAYRAAFRPGVTHANPLGTLRAIGAPWLRAEANTFLVSHGRRPLP